MLALILAIGSYISCFFGVNIFCLFFSETDVLALILALGSYISCFFGVNIFCLFFFRDRCVGTNLGTWYAVQQPQTREATPASLPPNVLQALYLCPSVSFFVLFLVIYHSLVEKAQKNSTDPKIGTKINPKMVRSDVLPLQ